MEKIVDQWEYPAYQAERSAKQNEKYYRKQIYVVPVYAIRQIGKLG